jgi:hypothetical protein
MKLSNKNKVMVIKAMIIMAWLSRDRIDLYRQPDACRFKNPNLLLLKKRILTVDDDN